MSGRSKYTPELKIRICEEYLAGELSMKQLCHKYGVVFNEKAKSCKVYKWLAIYKEKGLLAFEQRAGNRTYSKEFKTLAVEEYLSGKGSLLEICIKYDIPSDSILLKWIQCYNANRELKDYCPKREVYMAEARRKTTIEERKEIVEYCISHNRDYKGTASTYDVSYSQVYSWVKKYVANGYEGLTDKRGRHKSDDEVDELERLRRENARLKRQLEEKDMLTELLKKVQEFERM